MKKPKTPVAPVAQAGGPRAFIVKTLKRLSHSKSQRQVWDDWIEAMALAFANMPGNAVHMLRGDLWQQREARYMTLVGGYKPEEWRELAGLLGVLTELLEQYETGGPDAQRTAWRGGGDPLGELFMELEFANADVGQFFTPWELTMLKAQLTLGDLEEMVDDLGFVTVEDPACGSAATLLAAAAHARTLDINPQTQMRFHGRDISASAVHMAFVNCAIRGLPAVIEHGDTLRMEIWSAWETPAYVMGLWRYRRQRDPNAVDPHVAAVLAWLGRDDVRAPLPVLLAVVELARQQGRALTPEVTAALEALRPQLDDLPEEFSALQNQA